jgi:hypothetical protein
MRECPRVVVVQKFCQLLAQTLVTFALMAEDDGAFEDGVLQVLRQRAPQIGGSRAENQKIARRDIVDDAIRMLTHDLTRMG